MDVSRNRTHNTQEPLAAESTALSTGPQHDIRDVKGFKTFQLPLKILCTIGK